MFMHGGLTHIFFNMFALWMFGRVVETVWGPRRFLIYYFVTGLGAVALHTFVNFLDFSSIQREIIAFSNTPSPQLLNEFVRANLNRPSRELMDFIANWYDDPTNMAFADEGLKIMQRILQIKMDIPTVGASGAVFGVLLGFGVLFPNTQLMLLFPPIPIKAKYFVIGYGILELYLGLTRPGSNIAHFAHLGGMIFGYLLIRYWNKHTNYFY